MALDIFFKNNMAAIQNGRSFLIFYEIFYSIGQPVLIVGQLHDPRSMKMHSESVDGSARRTTLSLMRLRLLVTSWRANQSHLVPSVIGKAIGPSISAMLDITTFGT